MRLRGFTLIEMLVTLSLVGLLAMVSMPLYEVTSVRLRETELRDGLRRLRDAIDAYKAAADRNMIQREAGDSGYPPDLDVLVHGVEDLSDARHGKLVFLRQMPRDPFATDPTLPAARTWALRSYGDPPGQSSSGPDVYDVASRSERRGLNGIPYKDW